MVSQYVALVSATRAKIDHDAEQAGPIPVRSSALASLDKTTEKARP